MFFYLLVTIAPLPYKYILPMTRKPFFNVLVTDFDGTLSTTDTTPALASTLDAIHNSTDKYKHVPSFQHFSDKYMTDYNAYEAWIERRFANRVRRGEQCSYGWLVEYLRGTRWMEKRSMDRMIADGFYRGATRQQMYDTGAHSPFVQMLPNVPQALASIWSRCPSNINPITVLSIGWSADMILGGINHSVQQFLSSVDNPDSGFDQEKVKSLASQLTVVNPNMEYNHVTGISTGRLSNELYTGIDKINAFNLIIEQYKIESGRPDLKFAYAGDSLTDMLCLRKCPPRPRYTMPLGAGSHPITNI